VTDAHAVVRRAHPDLVILDLWLAKREDGWAFLRRLCADLETAHTPAIIASGQPAMPSGAAEPLRTMQCQVMVEPCDSRELLRAIEMALGPSPVRSHRDTTMPGAPQADPSVAETSDYPLATAAGGV
jgi:CheY-like chemotaxis protein